MKTRLMHCPPLQLGPKNDFANVLTSNVEPGLAPALADPMVGPTQCVTKDGKPPHWLERESGGVPRENSRTVHFATWALAALLVAGFATSGRAQEPARLKLDNLSKLADKADEVTDVNLDGAMLKFASKFINDDDDPEERQIQEMVKKLKGIYIKSFEFEKEGQYSEADVESVREQLRRPGWQKMVNVRSKRDKETDEIYFLGDENNIQGLVIFAAEPKEFTVVNIVGPIDLDMLSELGGHMGIPSVEVKKGGREGGHAESK